LKRKAGQSERRRTRMNFDQEVSGQTSSSSLSSVWTKDSLRGTLPSARCQSYPTKVTRNNTVGRISLLAMRGPTTDLYQLRGRRTDWMSRGQLSRGRVDCGRLSLGGTDTNLISASKLIKQMIHEDRSRLISARCCDSSSSDSNSCTVAKFTPNKCETANVSDRLRSRRIRQGALPYEELSSVKESRQIASRRDKKRLAAGKLRAFKQFLYQNGVKGEKLTTLGTF